MTGETLGELIAAYYRCHPCWICAEQRAAILGAARAAFQPAPPPTPPWCAHREPDVTLAEIERLERPGGIRRKPVASEVRSEARNRGAGG